MDYFHVHIEKIKINLESKIKNIFTELCIFLPIQNKKYKPKIIKRSSATMLSKSTKGWPYSTRKEKKLPIKMKPEKLYNSSTKN